MAARCRRGTDSATCYTSEVCDSSLNVVCNSATCSTSVEQWVLIQEFTRSSSSGIPWSSNGSHARAIFYSRTKAEASRALRPSGGSRAKAKRGRRAKAEATGAREYNRKRFESEALDVSRASSGSVSVPVADTTSEQRHSMTSGFRTTGRASGLYSCLATSP